VNTCGNIRRGEESAARRSEFNKSSRKESRPDALKQGKKRGTSTEFDSLKEKDHRTKEKTDRRNDEQRTTFQEAESRRMPSAGQPLGRG